MQTGSPSLASQPTHAKGLPLGAGMHSLSVLILTDIKILQLLPLVADVLLSVLEAYIVRVL